MSFVRASVRALVPLICLLALQGNWACGGHATVPVHQVSGARLSPYSGRALSDDEVRQLIFRALTARRWQVENEQPGMVVARYRHHRNYALVRLDYNGLGYSISYVETSPGLRYDGANVHRAYNQWVEHLDDAIKHEFEVYEHLPTTGELTPVSTATGEPQVPVLGPGPQTQPMPAPAPVEPAPASTPSPGLAPATPATGLAPSAPYAPPAPAAQPVRK